VDVVNVVSLPSVLRLHLGEARNQRGYLPRDQPRIQKYCVVKVQPRYGLHNHESYIFGCVRLLSCELAVGRNHLRDRYAPHVMAQPSLLRVKPPQP
jgi:hypothetical protein